MKKSLSILLLLLLNFTAFSQIKGNAITISRQNISQKNLGHGVVYGKPSNVIYHKLVPNPAITIDVKALHNAVASSYTAVFNINQIGETSEKTYELMSERIQKVKSELLSKGILEKDIVIDVISFVPVYETVVEKKLFSKKYHEVPKGFELQQNIHIKFTKTNQFEAILSACSKNEIYNLVKVDYYIEDLQEIYKNLRASVLQELKAKQLYYKDIGFDLAEYDKTVAGTKYCYFPRDFYKNYQAFNSVSFEALKKSKGVLEAKKQISYYYDPISFKDYDIVVNPSIVEPVIQIGIELKLQYVPKPKEQKPTEKEVIKNKYFIISPDGEIDIKALETT